MRMKIFDSAKSTLWYQRTSRSFPSLPFAFGKITKSAPFSFIEVNIAVNIQLWGHCVIRSSFLKSQNRGQSGGQLRLYTLGWRSFEIVYILLGLGTLRVNIISLSTFLKPKQSNSIKKSVKIHDTHFLQEATLKKVTKTLL